VIYYNGKILTVNSSFSVVEAVSISGDRFQVIGSNSEVLKTSGNDTVAIDLAGKTVIPGMIDSHAHPSMAALNELSGEIPIIRSLEDLFGWIEREVASRPSGEWIVLPLFFISRIREQAYPLIDELDALAPDHPVFLNGSYSGMVNTKALEVSGLLSRDFHPGIIIDSETEKPTGIILPEIFSQLTYEATEKPDSPEFAGAIEAVLEQYNSVGITGVTDGMVSDSEMQAYRLLQKENRLTVRLNTCILPRFNGEKPTAEEISAGLDISGNDSAAGLEAVKIILDGGILTGTAAIRDPWGKKAQNLFGYEDDDFRGVLFYTREQLIDIAVAAAERKRKFTAHCTGNRSLDMLLTAFEEADKVTAISNLHWSVIHGNFIDDKTISRMKKLGVVVECQMAWFYKDAPFIENILGAEYLRNFLPFRTMLEQGLVLAGGSDHMAGLDPVTSINPFNPFLSIGAAVTRKTESGQVLMAEEAVNRESALEMYTINGAFATGEVMERGSIESGKIADMVILDTDYLDCEAEKISEISVLTTIFGGRTVYERTMTE
jgi:predicted amidohydrolase YtcJ